MSYISEKCLGEHIYKIEGMRGISMFECWYYDDSYSIRHRSDGPAVLRYKLSLPGDGISVYQEWWYMGKKCSSQEEFEKFFKMKAFW